MRHWKVIVTDMPVPLADIARGICLRKYIEYVSFEELQTMVDEEGCFHDVGEAQEHLMYCEYEALKKEKDDHLIELLAKELPATR